MHTHTHTHTHNPPLHKQTLSFSDFPNVCALTQQASHYYLYLSYVFFRSFSLNAVLPFLYPPSFYGSHLFQAPFFTRPASLPPRQSSAWREGVDQMGSDVIAPQKNSFAARYLLPATSHKREEMKLQIRAATVCLITLKWFADSVIYIGCCWLLHQPGQNEEMAFLLNESSAWGWWYCNCAGVFVALRIR